MPLSERMGSWPDEMGFDDDGYVDFLFVDMLSVPPEFILGPSNGIAILGLTHDFITNDASARGSSIRIRHDRRAMAGGTLQQGFDFTTAVGTMAHEFGHVLGLPDLFDLDIRSYAPAQESAGIGYWGVMGHGVRGWDESGGPTPFCAFSLEQLGWIGAGNEDLVVVAENRRDVAIGDVRAGGQVFKIPTAAPDRYLLVEHRRPGNSYYDRHLPGAGLLIWQVDQGRERDGNRLEKTKQVDLACADGVYLEGIRPIGRVADLGEAGDQLDFWSRDADYRRENAGNLGDAGDLFDGVVYTEFSPATNPPAPPGISVRNIRRQGDRMLADFRVDGRQWAGILGEDAVWRDTVEVVGDLLVASGVRLMVEPGAVALFGGDEGALGADPRRIEIAVEGELKIGGEGLPVALVSARENSRAADWYGIVVDILGYLDLANAEIAHCWQGVTGVALHRSLTLANVTIRQVSQFGVFLRYPLSRVSLKDVEVRQTGLSGVYVEGNNELQVERGRFRENGRGGLERVGGTLVCVESEFADNGVGDPAGANLLLGKGVRGSVRGSRFTGGVGIRCAGLPGSTSRGIASGTVASGSRSRTPGCGSSGTSSWTANRCC